MTCSSCGQELRLGGEPLPNVKCWTCHPAGQIQLGKTQDRRVKHWAAKTRRKK